MIELTKNNYLEYGFGERPYAIRKNKHENFWVKFKRVNRKVSSFKNECIRACQSIHDRYPKPLNIIYSGGMDSELVVRSFLEAKIDFVVTTLRMDQEYNSHDINYAINFCKEHQLKHNIVNINIFDFWEKEVFKYATDTYCTSPQFPLLMWLIDQIEGTPILGSGDSAIKRVESTNKFNFHEQENYFSLYNFLLLRNREGVPAFFQYSPELLLSFFKDPILKEYINFKAKEEKLLSISKYKYFIYKNSFYNLKKRPVYNGYEKIKHQELIVRNNIKKLLPGGGEEILFDYNDFTRGLNETFSQQ